MISTMLLSSVLSGATIYVELREVARDAAWGRLEEFASSARGVLLLKPKRVEDS